MSKKPGTSPIAVVVFAADDKQLATVDVALGPCVPKPGRKKSLCSPLTQDLGETREHVVALFAVLADQPTSEALELQANDGAGALYRCSKAFLDAMADRSETLLALVDPDEFDRAQDILSEAWMRAAAWPEHYVSVKNRLHRIHLARQARSKGLPLYFWFGPSVAVRSIVPGIGPYPVGSA